MALRSIPNFASRAAASRLGQTLFVVHLALAVYLIAQKPPPTPADLADGCQVLFVAGRAVRIPEETPLLQIIFFLDLPSLLAARTLLYAGMLIAVLLGLHPTFDTLVLLQTVALFILTGVQWWVTGFLMQPLAGRLIKP